MQLRPPFPAAVRFLEPARADTAFRLGSLELILEVLGLVQSPHS